MSKKRKFDYNMRVADDRLRVAIMRKDLEENPRPLDQLEAELKEGNWPRRIRKKAIWQLSQEPRALANAFLVASSRLRSG
jgi:hypothetical protein